MRLELQKSEDKHLADFNSQEEATTEKKSQDFSVIKEDFTATIIVVSARMLTVMSLDINSDNFSL